METAKQIEIRGEVWLAGKTQSKTCAKSGAPSTSSARTLCIPEKPRTANGFRSVVST